MANIKISEFLLNRYGLRLKDLSGDLYTDEYNKKVVAAMSNFIPQLSDNFILTENDTVDSLINNLQLLDENPSMNIDTVYNTKFKVFMNRYTYDYAYCPAAPKRVTMQIIDPESFLFDDKFPDNRYGIYKLTAELIPNSSRYVVNYNYFTVTGPNTISMTSFQSSTNASLVWEPINRRFEITINSSTKAKFLQDTEYDVFIEWCGSDFINLEKPVYVDIDSQNNYTQSFANIKECEDNFNYVEDIYNYTLDTDAHNIIQQYRDNLYAWHNPKNNWSIVSDKFNLFDIIIDEEQGNIDFNFSNSDTLILSNIGTMYDEHYTNGSSAINIQNVNNVILINCSVNHLNIANCQNVLCADCDFGYYSTRVNIPAYISFNDIKNIKLNNCKIDFGRFDPSHDLVSFVNCNDIKFNKCHIDVRVNQLIDLSLIHACDVNNIEFNNSSVKSAVLQKSIPVNLIDTNPIKYNNFILMDYVGKIKEAIV